jgi:hypothetical protein
VHEPTRQQGFGAPDFKIKSKGMILGYVEVKAIGTNLDKELKSDQFKKYRTLSDNILVTDYLQWIWLDSKTGKAKARERLIEESDLEGKTLRVNPEKAAAVEKIITAFSPNRRKYRTVTTVGPRLGRAVTVVAGFFVQRIAATIQSGR